MQTSCTLVDENRWYLTGVEFPSWVVGLRNRVGTLSNFMNFAEPQTKWMKEMWATVWENAIFQRILPHTILERQVQVQAAQILEHYGSDLRDLQVFVLASGGFVFGKMLFDALTKMSLENLPRFFSLRTRTYEGTNIAPWWVQVDTDSAFHVHFHLPWDGSMPENFCRWLLHNEQLDSRAPVLILDDVLDSGRTIETVKHGLGEIFREESIGTAFLVEKPSWLKTEKDPRSETAFNTSWVIVLGNPWLAWGGMDSWVGNDTEKRISRTGFWSGGIWAKV